MQGVTTATHLRLIGGDPGGPGVPQHLQHSGQFGIAGNVAGGLQPLGSPS